MKLLIPLLLLIIVGCKEKKGNVIPGTITSIGGIRIDTSIKVIHDTICLENAERNEEDTLYQQYVTYAEPGYYSLHTYVVDKNDRWQIGYTEKDYPGRLPLDKTYSFAYYSSIVRGNYRQIKSLKWKELGKAMDYMKQLVLKRDTLRELNEPIIIVKESIND